MQNNVAKKDTRSIKIPPPEWKGRSWKVREIRDGGGLVIRHAPKGVVDAIGEKCLLLLQGEAAFPRPPRRANEPKICFTTMTARGRFDGEEGVKKYSILPCASNEEEEEEEEEEDEDDLDVSETLSSSVYQFNAGTPSSPDWVDYDRDGQACLSFFDSLFSYGPQSMREEGASFILHPDPSSSRGYATYIVHMEGEGREDSTACSMDQTNVSTGMTRGVRKVDRPLSPLDAYALSARKIERERKALKRTGKEGEGDGEGDGEADGGGKTGKSGGSNPLFDSFLTCPLSHQRFVAPVLASDGHTYDLDCIRRWIRQCKSERREIVSPLTKEVLSEDLLPNRWVFSLLQEGDRQDRQATPFSPSSNPSPSSNYFVVDLTSDQEDDKEEDDQEVNIQDESGEDDQEVDTDKEDGSDLWTGLSSLSRPSKRRRCLFPSSRPSSRPSSPSSHIPSSSPPPSSPPPSPSPSPSPLPSPLPSPPSFSLQDEYDYEDEDEGDDLHSQYPSDLTLLRQPFSSAG